MNPQKLLERIGHGEVNNVRFSDFIRLVEAFGFVERESRGSHRYFERPDVAQLLNLQPKGGQAKPYQIKQFLLLVEAYHLTLGNGQ